MYGASKIFSADRELLSECLWAFMSRVGCHLQPHVCNIDFMKWTKRIHHAIKVSGALNYDTAKMFILYIMVVIRLPIAGITGNIIAWMKLVANKHLFFRHREGIYDITGV